MTISNSSNIITGNDNHLLEHLLNSFEKAKRIRIVVAFIMESGAKLLVPALEKAVGLGAEIKIITGKYLNITEPSALYLLKDKLKDRVDLRFYNVLDKSFHPKAYLVDEEDDSTVFVGSSNVSLSALTTGIEWNYKLKKSVSPQDYQDFSDAFEHLYDKLTDPFTDENLRNYASVWHKSPVIRAAEKLLAQNKTAASPVVEPQGAQIEALYELRLAREEGIQKGMVVAATGVGKTFLAAFDSREFKKVLFVAHREEILKQAADSFGIVRPWDSQGFFTGADKKSEADLVFATVQTIGQEKYLQAEVFAPDYFDYIVVDEFHHAAAESYQQLLKYFRPRFLLGLTATPYRSDNRDIFALCDDNVIYEIYLNDAINRDLLVPFRYYGIFDCVDYDGIEYRNGKYVLDELERALATDRRADLVLQHFQKYRSSRAMGFCASIKHAEYMAEYFSDRGVAACAVHSGKARNKYVLVREEALCRLAKGKIKVVFSVDLFNEGIDLPEIDLVMFLRPTESYVVFLQQLGRGLRKAAGKEFLTVLDFIGNYRRAHYIPALLAGENPLTIDCKGGLRPHELSYPDLCEVFFDFKLIDLFDEVRKRDPLAKRMVDEYFRLKRELGRRPGRLDIFEGVDISVREYLKKGYIRFLDDIDELDEVEKSWLDTEAEKFLRVLEKTSMSKSYKIPTLMAFLDEDELHVAVTIEEVGQSFKDYYAASPVHQKDLHDKSNRDWQSWNLSQFVSLARRNPVHFLSRTQFFDYDQGSDIFSIDEALSSYISPDLARHMQDIVLFKSRDYFRRKYKEDMHA